jgi:hypothetical protein
MVIFLAFLFGLIPCLWFTRLVKAETVSTDITNSAPVYPAETLITLLGSSISTSGSGAVVAGTTVTITAGGDYRATGTLNDGMIVVDTTEAVTLTLDSVAITHTTGSAIYVVGADKLTLILAGGSTNTLVDGATYSSTSMKSTLFSNDTLEITGTGSLSVTGNYKHCIAGDDNIIVSGGVITITSAVKDGFHVNEDITVAGGDVTVISASSDGFESEGTLTVSGGTLSMAVTSNGIKSADTLTITNGIIDITSATEGIESKNNLVINGGELTIITSDDGLNAINDITIQGGQIYINAAGDAIDSNSTMHINGGVIIALGDASESGLDCNDVCEPIFTGGTVIATGGSNDTPSNSSTQHVVVLGSKPAGSAIHIMNSDDTDVLTFEVSKDYNGMIFTSPTLTSSTTYPVYAGGTIAGGSNFHGLYTSATYSGGRAWAFFTTSNMVTYATDALHYFAPLINLDY